MNASCWKMSCQTVENLAMKLFLLILYAVSFCMASGCHATGRFGDNDATIIAIDSDSHLVISLSYYPDIRIAAGKPKIVYAIWDDGFFMRSSADGSDLMYGKVSDRVVRRIMSSRSLAISQGGVVLHEFMGGDKFVMQKSVRSDSESGKFVLSWSSASFGVSPSMAGHEEYSRVIFESYELGHIMPPSGQKIENLRRFKNRIYDVGEEWYAYYSMSKDTALP